jgi:sulfur carrier protein ThiS
MKVTVKLIGPFIYDAGYSEKDVEAPGSITLAALLDLLNIPKERPKIITRNGRAVVPQELLEDGDRIAISPIYSGG